MHTHSPAFIHSDQRERGGRREREWEREKGEGRRERKRERKRSLHVL